MAKAKRVIRVAPRQPEPAPPKEPASPAAAPAERAESTLPPVGVIEHASDSEAAGWAWDPMRPDEPVDVEVLEGDQLLCRVRADLPRNDLRDGGVGNGRHGFRIAYPAALFPAARHVVRIVRAADGRDLTRSPFVIARNRQPMTEATRTLIRQSVSECAESGAEEDLNLCVQLLLQGLDTVLTARNARMGITAAENRQVVASLGEVPVGDLVRGTLARLVEEYPPLHFPDVEQPKVSIVIPVYNKFPLTYACLAALYSSLPRVAFEIVIVDDGSSDETMFAQLALGGAVRLVRNPRNLGFVGSCNHGASVARGTYLCFLNNDTLPREGWLDELVWTVENVDDVGIAGSKLLNQDGSLQEVGGIIWRLGDGWNWGRGKDAADPRFQFLRDADWVSGAALLIARDLFERLGRFGPEYAPGYYEDTDLCFKVREAGLRVVVQPKSEVVHLEGQTSGTSVTGGGMKRFQAINHRKFFEKWKHELTRHRFNGESPELEAERGVTRRALFIDDSVPTPDQDAGSNAAFDHMLCLQRLGYKVVFVPADNMARIDPYTAALERHGIECVHAPYYWSVEEFCRKAQSQFDLAYLHRMSNATKYIGILRNHFRKIRIVFNVADLHFLRMERMAAVMQDADLAEQVVRSREVELQCVRQADCTIVHSAAEKEILAEAAPGAKVVVAPWTFEPRPLAGGRTEPDGIVFIGGYRHHPNVDAAFWIINEIAPLVAREDDAIRFDLVGSHMPDELRRQQRGNVRCLGFVPDALAVLRSARCSIAPLRYGAGLKGKVLQSFSVGVPCLMTEIAAEGLALPAELREAQVGDSAAELAELVVRHERAPAWSRDIGRAARDWLATAYSREAVLASLRQAVEMR